ncbi:MAG: methyltransferase domain-containing protein [Dehalococcoidia bacterium]|nr:methyltransferase domain-containing protein [Dehalococcoidia bacterium]
MDVVRFYERGGEATHLFESPAGKLEYLRTREIIQRYLKAPPGTILDVGGGPGVYACWLASLGYKVHLFDPLDYHVQQALEASARQPDQPLASAIVSDARNLKEVPDGIADAVLLLGPLYHITEYDERGFAWHEAYRVLKPGGFAFATSISRFAWTLFGMREGYIEDPKYREMIARDISDGQHRNPYDDKPEYFATSYMHHPSDLRREMAVAGLLHQATIAVEGPAWLLSNLGDYLDAPEKTELLLSTLKAIESDPGLLGATSHVMCVGQRPA